MLRIATEPGSFHAAEEEPPDWLVVERRGEQGATGGYENPVVTADLHHLAAYFDLYVALLYIQDLLRVEVCIPA